MTGYKNNLFHFVYVLHQELFDSSEKMVIAKLYKHNAKMKEKSALATIIHSQKRMV